MVPRSDLRSVSMRSSSSVTSGCWGVASGSTESSCMVETMMPMNRLRMVKVAMTMKGTKNAHAHGWLAMTGRTMPIDQLSRVMIWNKV